MLPCVFFIIFLAWYQWKLNLGYTDTLAIVLTHWKLLFCWYHPMLLLKIWNCCKINYFKIYGIAVSCLSNFLLKNQISFTIILNDLIFCKLDVIPTTLFSMHKALIWSLKIGNSELQQHPMNHKTCKGSWKHAIMTLERCLYRYNSHIWGGINAAFWNKI